MKARCALAASLVLCAAATAGIVIEELPGTVLLKQTVRLSDGHVLPASAAPYDVKIHFQGFGNTAEIWFFTGGVFKGKTNAEARGFPSSPPGAPGGPGAARIVADESPKEFKFRNADDVQVKLVPGDPAAQKGFPKVESTEKVDKKYVKLDSAGAAQTFSWNTHGFQKGLKGQATVSSRGFVKLSFDSANSPAGFSAQLPAVQK
jgi:hypothetical protein